MNEHSNSSAASATTISDESITEDINQQPQVQNNTTKTKKTLTNEQRQRNRSYQDDMVKLRNYQICFLVYVFMLVNNNYEIRLFTNERNSSKNTLHSAFTHISNSANGDFFEINAPEPKSSSYLRRQSSLFNNELISELVGNIDENTLNEKKKNSDAKSLIIPVNNVETGCACDMLYYKKKKTVFHKLDGFTFNYMGSTYTYSSYKIYNVGESIYNNYVIEQIKYGSFKTNKYIKITPDDNVMNMLTNGSMPKPDNNTLPNPSNFPVNNNSVNNKPKDHSLLENMANNYDPVAASVCNLGSFGFGGSTNFSANTNFIDNKPTAHKSDIPKPIHFEFNQSLKMLDVNKAIHEEHMRQFYDHIAKNYPNSYVKPAHVYDSNNIQGSCSNFNPFAFSGNNNFSTNNTTKNHGSFTNPPDDSYRINASVSNLSRPFDFFKHSKPNNDKDTSSDD